jgi:electron transfer flavoprotein beta subunit
MHIVCCVKQVPDTAQVKIDPDTNTLVRSGVESICNPYDLVAVEAATQLVEKHGGKVTVLTMGPPQAETALRECLALGAADAVLLSDRAFAGADTLATSYALAQAVTVLARFTPVDLVLCGKQAIDGDTAQTGPGIATRLGFTQLTYVSKIIEVDPAGRTVRVQREVEGGREIVEGKLPALLTAELELAAPRYASLPDLLRALRYPVGTWGARQIEGLPEKLGLKGSPTSVKEIFTPPLRKGGPVFESVAEFLEAFSKNEAARLGELLTEG